MLNKTMTVALALTASLAWGISLEGPGTKLEGPEDLTWFLSEVYQSKPRQDKMQDLWRMIVPDPHVSEAPIDFHWAEWPTIFTQDMQLSFTSSDEMPEGRKKFAHTQGVVAQVKWTPIEGHGYSGMFKTGSQDVIMRLSETAMLHEKSTGLTPSVAFKFLRDGTSSDNIVAMPSFSNSGSWNFLERPMKTRVAPFAPDSCEDQTIRKKLVEGSQWPFSCGISHVARDHADGTFLPDEAVIVPYELAFEALAPYDAAYDYEIVDGVQVKWYDQLKRIKAGAKLFQVNALTAPVGAGGVWVPIATIELLTDLYTSTFGDTRLFFSHERVNHDRIYWPKTWFKADGESDPRWAKTEENTWGNWVPAEEDGGWPSNDADAKAMYMDQQQTHGCPFYWLIEAIQDL